MKPIYLDYAATTPVDPRVFQAMEPYFGAGNSVAKFGNPGSLHSFGQAAIAAVDASREVIARSIGAEFRDVIFTSSATEANNVALRGVIKTAKVTNPRVIVSVVEHESILETVRDLEHEGVEVIYIPVDRHGAIDIKQLKASLNERTVLASFIYANNEIGTIQPIAEIAKMIADVKTVNGYPLFHTDAAQAFQFLNCDIQALGVDLMTLSSHKIYGPKGGAALYLRASTVTKKNALRPLLVGGGQEFGWRSGTENVPAIVGFAAAVELADAVRQKEAKRIGGLRDHLWRGIKKICPGVEWNGASDKNSAALVSHLLPNIVNVYFPNYSAQDLLMRFDLAGLAVSSGSACRSRALTASYVIESLGHSKEYAKASIRFSLGRPTTQQEIDNALKVIQRTISS